MAGPQGVDFSNIPRHSLYATPTTPRSGPRVSTAYSATASSRSKVASTPTGMLGSAQSNAGRKRSRLSYSPSKRGSMVTGIPTGAGAGTGIRGGGGEVGRRRSTTATTTMTTTTAGRQSTALPTPANSSSGSNSSHMNGLPTTPRSAIQSDYQSPGMVSPAPLANSQYRLAQGFDPATAAQADAYDRPLFSAEAERTRLFSRLRDDELDRPTFANGLDGVAADLAGPLARGRWQGGGGNDGTAQNGYNLSDVADDDDDYNDGVVTPLQRPVNSGGDGSDNGNQQNWSVSRVLFNTVTGVAGMVFHFCTAGAFRGFTAGGGQAWAVNARDGGPAKPSGEKSHLDMEDSWQDADFAQDGEDHTSASAATFSYFQASSPWPPSPVSTPRAAKKLKSSYTDDGGLRSNWILVGDEDAVSRPASPANSKASPAGLRRSNTATTLTTVMTPVTGRRRRFTATVSMPIGGGSDSVFGSSSTSSTKQASSAALRSPGIRREISSNTALLGSGRRSRAGSVRSSFAGAGLPSSSSSSSSAALAAAATASDGMKESPLGKEGERLIRMKEKREREEDRELSRMNRRLEEMIRQGREALSTKYEVEELDESSNDVMFQ